MLLSIKSQQMKRTRRHNQQRAVHYSLLSKTFIVLLLLCMCGYAQQPREFSAAQVAQIQQQVQAVMEQEKIPALSLAIISQRGQMSAGYGQADVANALAATASTKYRLASLSKPITAVAVMQLAEKGELDLDAPVQKYVPSFPVKPWPITSRELLGHLSGIRHYEGEGVITNHHYDTLTDALDVFKDAPLLSEPGTTYHYSSYGYNLLGCVVEGASGMKFEDYIRQYIFEPANMKASGIYDPRHRPADLARGYTVKPDGTVVRSEPGDTSYKTPSGGIYSTVEDMANFAVALQSGKLVRPETLNQMWTRQRTRDGKYTAYGLGWDLIEYAGHLEVDHSGSQSGTTTLLYMRPQEHLIVTLMCNMRDEPRGPYKQIHALARQLANIATR
ncbi:MAG: beta-lactamase family protein [Abitibacteriaceae bacterium]|nr:beta-lactamase family protein [Abditibacteriaceae bacterium]